ncbi:MAG: DUF3179 domain-containing protein [Caldilinea sp.]|nr:DUF3179 domain-containing protein [Caldilinea sp.]
MSRAHFSMSIVTVFFMAASVAVACAPPPPPTPTVPPAATATAATGDVLLPASTPPFDTAGWQTDFTRRTVAWEEIRSGGPPKDGIPAIDAPAFEAVSAAATWLSERDPVILFQAGDDVRAYPLAILIWHEIVNDVVGGQPVAVTFCPLCNASIVFDRTFEGEVLDFGTTGNLRNSDLIMYDRQSETWWQQFSGEGIVGTHAGRRLAFIPSQVIRFGDFAERFPEGRVLARPESIARSYGANPYVGYDSRDGRPFLFDGTLDERLPGTERVADIAVDGTARAYPFTVAAAQGAINDEVAGTPIVVFHKPGTASALDSGAIAEGRDVGSVAVYARTLDGQVLTFAANGDGTFTDAETSSTWTILGEAVAGPRQGEQLRQVLAFDHFWFAWAAFHPGTEIYEESSTRN